MKLKAFQDREEARLTKLREMNEKRAEALPDYLKGLLPPSLSPDDIAEQISKLEQIVTKRQVDIFAGSGRRHEPSQNLEKIGHDIIFSNNRS